MTTITTDSPSGMRLVVRGLTLSEVDLLASARKARRVDVMDQVLGKCWQETLSPGPYSFTGRPIWDEVLQADREDVFYAIRRAMYGPEYEFRVQCDIASCRHSFMHTVNLEELPVQRLSPENAEIFRGGNRFSVEIDGHEYVYQLATGASLKKFEAQRQSRPQHIQLLALATRVVEIRSLADGRTLGRADVMTHLAMLPMTTVEDLRDEFDAHDCGIITLIEGVECPNCFSEQDVDLPFDEGFFSPRTRKRAAKRRRRISATSSAGPTSQDRSGTGSANSATSRSSEPGSEG